MLLGKNNLPVQRGLSCKKLREREWFSELLENLRRGVLDRFFSLAVGVDQDDSTKGYSATNKGENCWHFL